MILLKGFVLYSLGLCVVVMVLALVKGRIDAFVVLIPFLVVGVVTHRWFSRRMKAARAASSGDGNVE